MQHKGDTEYAAFGALAGAVQLPTLLVLTNGLALVQLHTLSHNYYKHSEHSTYVYCTIWVATPPSEEGAQEPWRSPTLTVILLVVAFKGFLQQ